MADQPGSRWEGAPDLGLSQIASDNEHSPGFAFQGVALRTFPLRANAAQLQSFLDQYLNLSPVAYFRPASPFVLFSAINYGRMEPAATNIGWTTQDEFTFSIPLHWYRREKGHWVFHANASVAPFLFVDDASSVVTGCEVYGWPKVLAKVGAEVNPWMRDLRCRQFADARAGRRRRRSRRSHGLGPRADARRAGVSHRKLHGCR